MCGAALTGQPAPYGQTAPLPGFTAVEKNGRRRLLAVLLVVAGALLFLDLLSTGLLFLAKSRADETYGELREATNIEVFIKNSARQREIDALGDRIKSMPEVETTDYVSKEEALNRLRASMQGHEDLLNSLEGNPLPASYLITVDDSDRVEEVAARFYDDPLVDNTPGTHDGVKFSIDPRGARHHRNIEIGLYFTIIIACLLTIACGVLAVLLVRDTRQRLPMSHIG